MSVTAIRISDIKNDADAVAAEDRQAYASGMADDLLDQLVSRLQGEIGVTTNPAAIQQALSF